MKRARLIAFEGLDGSGKSTQLASLAEALRAAGHRVVETREPTGGPYGQRIRVMAASGQHVAPEEELRWFVEDRREHVAAVIAPALARAEIVLSDRYYLSSVAYQGARGLDASAILRESEAEFPIPDLALVLEIAPSAGLARVAARGGRAEPAFEEAAFLEEAAALYHSLRCAYVERLDARGTAERVRDAVASAVRRRLDLP